jgi:5-methyltetrahydropteroyltriglutamate--homocysteine methyltransferase
MIFPSTVAGSLPKPAWLAEPNKLWPQWRLQGDELAAAKLDATLLAIKWQEDAGIDIVCDGEMSRQHFVHGFLEFVDGIDFAHKVEMGIRGGRYKAMVPVVRGELKLKGRVHQTEARFARAHTRHKLKFTMPGPMTISDTVADAHYADKIKVAMTFADLLNQEARALEKDGVDVIQFDEPAFNVFMGEVSGWGIEALSMDSNAPPPCTSAMGTGSRRTSTGKVHSATNGASTRRSFPRWQRVASARFQSNASTHTFRSSFCPCSRARTCWSA